jgi:hypothetical protein
MKAGPLAIWTFAPDKPGFALICVDFLPRLVTELGVAAVRFLDVIVPPLAQLLRFPMLPVHLHEGAARALTASISAIGTAAHLLERWRGTVLAAVGMCWQQRDTDGADALGAALAQLVRALQVACPLVSVSHCPDGRATAKRSLPPIQADIARLDRLTSGSLRPVLGMVAAAA